MSESKIRKRYDREFKLSAVKLVQDSGRSVSSIARELGVSENALFIWKKKYLEDSNNAFPGKGHIKPEEEENRRLKKELAHVTMERDILKKAVAFFAKETH
jgi:Transposase and inactivated derivatives